jgi:hypothetical protein
MNKGKKKRYEKPQLVGEPLFEAVGLACCKATVTCSSATGRTKNQCARPRT